MPAALYYPPIPDVVYDWYTAGCLTKQPLCEPVADTLTTTVFEAMATPPALPA